MQIIIHITAQWKRILYARQYYHIHAFNSHSYAVVVQNSAGVSTFYATLNTTTIPEGKELTVKLLA